MYQREEKVISSEKKIDFPGKPITQMENEMPDRSSKLKRQAQEGDRELIDIIKPDNSLKGFPTSIGKVLWLFLTFHHFFILSTKLTNFFSPTFFFTFKKLLCYYRVCAKVFNNYVSVFLYCCEKQYAEAEVFNTL